MRVKREKARGEGQQYRWNLLPVRCKRDENVDVLFKDEKKESNGNLGWWGVRTGADIICSTKNLFHFLCILISEQHLSLTALIQITRTTQLLKAVTVQIPQFEYHHSAED